MSSIGFIERLESIIDERLDGPSEDSYTASLAAAGVKRVAQKVGEEGVEVALAAVTGNRDETLNEAADLVYHLLVLLKVSDLRIADVAKTLEERHI